MRPNTPNRPGCGGYVLAMLLLIALAIPAFAWPQLSVRLLRQKWVGWRVDIYCPASEDCSTIEIIKSWQGAQIHTLDANHITIEVDNMASVPPFWIRVYSPSGGFTDHQTDEIQIYERERPALQGASLLPGFR